MGFLDGLFSGGGLKKLNATVEQIEKLEPEISSLTDEQLKAKTQEFKNRLNEGETLDDLLVEAFAVVREASVRAVGMRHFPVQLLGGIVLHQGRIAEMKTGEGKTLVATLPAYLNALKGEGVHLITVNDYLAKRDSQWMGKIYKFLGLTVGLITQEMDSSERKANYNCDITYGTNNQYGFDYLRDNMVVNREDMVQRGLHYAIVDEVDSILIDEARTPLIISGQGEKSTELYEVADKFVRKLKEEEDFDKDEKKHSANLTEEGVKKAEKYFSVENWSDLANTELNHHVNQALAAHYLKKRDKDYVVQDGEVVIVDEFTGRLMIGRRYSNGLHQAIEAKEGVKVLRESKTLATITFQNYFRMYHKLSGMTGTAKTEEDEFNAIYNLDVVVIPTNKACAREDKNDVIFLDINKKYDAVIDEVIKRHEIGQPVLVGTVTVEDSELLSSMLKKKGIKHQVLNAKNHQREAEIIAQAGKVGAVTIATNMAGRGTDIILGGNPDFLARRDMLNKGVSESVLEEATGHASTTDEEVLKAREEYKQLHEKYKVVCDAEHEKVVEAGGLYIIGTQRHESRRIDNQLRGRAGRQGDPGVSVFYISMKDDLMRLFGGEWIRNTLDKLAAAGADDISMQYKMFSKRIEGVQKKVEAHNLEGRKHVLKYDDVMNKQREIIYTQRRDVLMGKDMKENVTSMIEEVIDTSVDFYLTADDPRIDELKGCFERIFEATVDLDTIDKAKWKEAQKELAFSMYEQKEKEVTEKGIDMREIERVIILRIVDMLWMDHIDNMDQLRRGIGLRAYAQRDPLIEYSIEGFDMFDEMINSIREDTVTQLFHGRIEVQEVRHQSAKITSEGRGNDGNEAKKPAVSKEKVGRNEPCPCGSGKKYKNCCGKDK